MEETDSYSGIREYVSDLSYEDEEGVQPYTSAPEGDGEDVSTEVERAIGDTGPVFSNDSRTS